MIAAILFALLAGAFAGVVVCKSWQLSVAADIALSGVSLMAMLAAAHLIDGIDSPSALLAAGVGYVAAAVAGKATKA